MIYQEQKCPLCRHEWARHDPDDGMCDAPDCRCGRDINFMRVRISALSKAALDARADARIARAALALLPNDPEGTP